MMIPEIGFSGQNLLMNTRGIIVQRQAALLSQVGAGYGADRWRIISERTDALALDNGGQIAVAAAGDHMSIARSSSGPNSNFLRIEQRMEDTLVSNIFENKMTMQVKIRRNAVNVTTTPKIKFFIKTAISLNTHTDLLDPLTGFDAVLDPIKLGSVIVGDVTVADTSDTEFEIFYATFDIPVGTENGLAASIALVNDAGSPLPNEWFIDVKDFMVSLGSSLPIYKPMGLNIPAAELPYLQRYYEKSYPIDEDPGSDQQFIGENALFSAVASSTIQTLNNGGEFKVLKRNANPTVQIYAYDGTPDRINENVSGVTFPNPVIANRVSQHGIQTLWDDLGGFTIGLSYWYCWTAETEI